MRMALALLVALLLAAAACGGDDEDAANVAEPGPATTAGPKAEAGDAVFGEYQRTVTRADLDRTAEKRAEGSEVPPTGRYRLTLSEGAIVVVDPNRFSISQELTVTDDTLTVERYIGEGFFCPDDSPSSYRWTLDSERLTLAPQKDGCADRDSILTGAWTKKR